MMHRIIATLALGAGLALSGCNEGGEADRVGDQTEDALENTGDAIEDGADEAGDAVEDAGREIEQGAEDLEDRTDR